MVSFIVFSKHSRPINGEILHQKDKLMAMMSRVNSSHALSLNVLFVTCMQLTLNAFILVYVTFSHLRSKP